MKKKQMFWWGLIVVVLAIQLIPVHRPEIIEQNPADLIQTTQVPPAVASLLKNSCYDCHSMQTTYPWYAHVAPISWLVSRDVRDGRRHVNFSDWNNLKLSKKAKVLDKISDEVSDGSMPFFLYPLMHKKAKLTAADRKQIVDWTHSYSKGLVGDK